MAEEARSALENMRAILQQALDLSVPLSPRAHVLAALDRIAERALKVLDRVDDPDAGIDQLATVLELRDLAREEQRWVDSLFRDETPEEAHRQVLIIFKVVMSQIEAASMNAIALAGSNRQAESAWWATRAGELAAKAMSVATGAFGLPDGRLG